MQIHFLVGQAGKPVKAKGRAGCPPHNKLSLQKWDAPSRKLVYSASRLSEIRNLTSNPFPSREGGKLLSRVGERGQSDCLLLHQLS